MDNQKDLEELKKLSSMTTEEKIKELKESFKPYKAEEQFEQVPCNNCQGGGCTTCGGSGYWLQAVTPKGID